MNLDERINIAERILTDFVEIIFEHVSEVDKDFSIEEHFLIELIGQRESATMSELASFFSTPPTTMTSIVNRLIEKGYLSRCRSEKDRRVVLISLSAKGEEYYRNHKQEYKGIFKKYLFNLSEEELKKTSQLLAKVKKALLNK
ncbi:MarR family transcriptional regulator [Orenia metallireducens]|uniref:Transcriptional regulator, MarR family n=1 Tax=Orenia metallireducens TaxID=1413210 RepID=A0A285HJQ8_9FIRM|nr:MarR family transcriptional regulator [Orenia metallireducens]PRX27145.1 MarR family transcriptional regulator [Orenia metallireducens]SNY34921.1 transcriptional regulator, MarR family [Orenia metallireducens]